MALRLIARSAKTANALRVQTSASAREEFLYSHDDHTVGESLMTKAMDKETTNYLIINKRPERKRDHWL